MRLDRAQVTYARQDDASAQRDPKLTSLAFDDYRFISPSIVDAPSARLCSAASLSQPVAVAARVAVACRARPALPAPSQLPDGLTKVTFVLDAIIPTRSHCS